MDINELKRINKKLESKDFNFSNLFVLKILFEREPAEYTHFNLADQLKRCGQYVESLKSFQSVSVNDIPDDKKKYYYIYLGQLYTDMGKIKLAKNAFKRSIELGNSSTIPYIYLSSIYLKENNIGKSIEVLNEAVNKEGDQDEVYYNLATRLAICNDILGAIGAKEKCLSIDPNYPNASGFLSDMKTWLMLSKSGVL